MMKRIVAILVLSSLATMAWAEEILDLYVGEIKILRVDKVDRVAVGNASLLGTSILKNGQLLVIGEGAGITSLHVWFANGRERDMTVRVEQLEVQTVKDEAELESKMAEVRALLNDINGLQVRIVGKRIVLSGKVDKTFETNIATVKSAFKEVMDLTRKEENVELPQNKMVLINMKVTEFNKSAGEQLGIDWDKTTSFLNAGYVKDFNGNNYARIEPESGSLVGKFPVGKHIDDGYFGIFSEITSRINFAVSRGDAIVLSEPRLVARSGGEASFLVGGEIPYDSVTGNPPIVTTEFKEFGISLNIKPVVDDKDFIHANIATEVSSPGSVAPGEPPPISTRKTAADVSMRSGQTLVLSGLIDQQSSRGVDKVALLGDIPVLGALFRSTTFNENKSELVIFLTPSVYSAESEENAEFLARQKRLVNDFKQVVEESNIEIID